MKTLAARQKKIRELILDSKSAIDIIYIAVQNYQFSITCKIVLFYSAAILNINCAALLNFIVFDSGAHFSKSFVLRQKRRTRLNDENK